MIKSMIAFKEKLNPSQHNIHTNRLTGMIMIEENSETVTLKKTQIPNPTFG